MRILFALVVVATAAQAETYPVRNDHGGAASAVCVGKYERNGVSEFVFLTNRHVVGNSQSPQLWVGNDDKRWHEATRIRRSSNERVDIASFSVATGNWRRTYLASEVPDGTQVTVCGYSTERDSFCFDGVMRGDTVRAADGTSVLPGDSGGAVLVRGPSGVYVAGVPWAYSFNSSDTRRQHRETMIVPASDCFNHLNRVYGANPRCVPWSQVQCPPGARYCPLPKPPPGRIRHERIEPRLFAPPRIERYEYDPSPDSGPVIPPPSLSEAEIRDFVRDEIRQYMADNPQTAEVKINVGQLAGILAEQYADQLRGIPGPPGPPGQDGLPGKPGARGDDGRNADVDLSSIERRISDLESRGRRVILREGGEIIDDETIGPNQPLVLDIERIIRSGK